MLIVLFVFEIPSTPNIFGMLGVTVVTASRYNLLILHKSLEVTAWSGVVLFETALFIAVTVCLCFYFLYVHF